MRSHCTIPSCDKLHQARGFCHKHYSRWLQHGDPLLVKNLWGVPPEQRFWLKVNKAGHDDCWLWTGATLPHGYGNFWANGKQVLAHRFAYELLVDPITDGLEIDHLCRNHACVNPEHLEAVSHRINVLRGDGPTAHHALKTHCPQGHPYDLFNTQIRPDGRRRCRSCGYERYGNGDTQ